MPGRLIGGAVTFIGTMLILAMVIWYRHPIWHIAPIGIWLWNVVDAASLAVGRKRSFLLPILLGLLAAYGIGWQVSQIDFSKASLTRAYLIARPMFKPDFIEPRREDNSIWVGVEVPCSPEPPQAYRYNEFSDHSRTATTPQDERRYLFALAAFQSPALLTRTLARTINGEIRTQDAPFVVSAVMGNVDGRELAWGFVKTNWDQMDRLFPKQGLRRMCGGIVGLATPELEQDVREFFHSRKIHLGGKTLEQYLEQLRIAVTFRERERQSLSGLLKL